MTDAGRSGGRAGLFLDMDGTLADSLSALRIAFGRFLGEHGVEATRERFERVNGVPLREAVATLRAEHGLLGEPKELLRRFVTLIGEVYGEVPLMPGARELVGAARSRGMAVALVTSAAEGFARGWLERHGLAPEFDAVVGGDSVPRGKPAPEPYLRALELTGARAARSVAVEDSLNGARSAVAAGIATFVLAPDAPGAPGGARAPAPGDWPAVAGFVVHLGDVPLEVRVVRD